VLRGNGSNRERHSAFGSQHSAKKLERRFGFQVLGFGKANPHKNRCRLALPKPETPKLETPFYDDYRPDFAR
jgi:hypothetical protein